MRKGFTPQHIAIVEQDLFGELVRTGASMDAETYHQKRVEGLKHFRKENDRLYEISGILVQAATPLFNLGVQNRMPVEDCCNMVYGGGWNDCYRFLRDQGTRIGWESNPDSLCTPEGIPIVDEDLFSTVIEEHAEANEFRESFVPTYDMKDFVRENPHLFSIFGMISLPKSCEITAAMSNRGIPIDKIMGHVYMGGWDDVYRFLREQGKRLMGSL